MGKGTNTVVSNTTPPQQVMEQYQNVQNAANSAAANPYYFYPGSLVAGFSPNQEAGIGATSDIASSLYNPANTYGIAQPFINAGAQYTAAGAQPITASQINQYMNPFLEQAGQTTLAEMNQNNAIQQQQLTGNAAASGALGGNRVGLARAALANQQDLATNAALANLNTQGFNTALGAAQTTAGQQLQAGFLMPQTGQLAENASLAGLNAAMSGAGAQTQAGTLEQQQQQNQLNAAYGQWLGNVQYPFQDVNFLTGVQSGVGSLMGGQSSTMYPGPSTGSQLMGAGLTAAALYNLLGAGTAAAAGAGAGAAAAAAKRGGRIYRDVGGRIYEKMAAGGYSVLPQSEAGSNDPGYIGPALPIAHGSGPPAPTNDPNFDPSANSQISNFSSISDFMKTLDDLKKKKPQDEAVSGKRSGGRIRRQSGGISEISTPLDQQIMDREEINKLSPGSSVRKITYAPPQGIDSLENRHGMETGGMAGVSALPLTGKFAALNATGTLGDTGSKWGNVDLPAVPQAGNLDLHVTGKGASFAPVTYPTGVSSGAISNSMGVPSDYFSSIYAAAPHNNWSIQALPLTPIDKPVDTNQNSNTTAQDYGPIYNMGGRIKKQDGGASDDENATGTLGDTAKIIPFKQPNTLGVRSPINPYPEVEQAAQQAAKPLPKNDIAPTTKLERMAESPWAALADAGFAMMAGTSPFPMVNIGRGLHEGAKYAVSMLGQQRERQALQGGFNPASPQNEIQRRQTATQAAGNLVNTQGQTASWISNTGLTMGPDGKVYAINPGTSEKVVVPPTSIRSAPGQVPLAASGPLPPQTISQRREAIAPYLPMPGPLGDWARGQQNQLDQYTSAGIYPTADGGYSVIPKTTTGYSGGVSVPSGKSVDITGWNVQPPSEPVPTQIVTSLDGSRQLPYKEVYQQAVDSLGSPYPYARNQATEWLEQRGPQKWQPLVTQLSNQADQLRNSELQLNDLSAASKDFLTGSTSQARSEMDRVLATLGSAIGVNAPDIQNASTAAQMIPKIQGFLLALNTRMASDRGGAQAMADMINTVPGIHNTPEAMKTLIRIYTAISDRSFEQAKFVSEAVNRAEMDGPAALNAFNAAYPPAAWASYAYPVALPTQKGQVDTNKLKVGYAYKWGDKIGVWNGKSMRALPN